MINHKDEWPQLTDIGRLNRLLPHEIIMLFALRELEDGSKGNEFNLLSVKDTNFTLQAMAMARNIAYADYSYQKYIKSKKEENEKIMPFLEFFKQSVIKQDIGEKDRVWRPQLEQLIDEIDEEFKFKKELT